MVNVESQLVLREGVHQRTWEDGNVVRHPESRHLWFEVDGMDLRDLMPVAQGMLTPLNRAWLDAVPDAVEVLLGNRAEPGLDPGRIPIFVCPVCGDIPCGAVTAMLSVRDDVVAWTQFQLENGYEPAKDVAGAPTELVFDAASYRSAMWGALQRVRAMLFDELEHSGRRFLWPWQWGWRLPKDE